MNDGPRAQGGEVPTSTGAKPSIAEVAAWLRRAAEQRDVVEDLRPLARQAPATPAADEAEENGEEEPSADAEATTGGGPPPDAPAPPGDSTGSTVADPPDLDGLPDTTAESSATSVEPDEPDDEPVARGADPDDEPSSVEARADDQSATGDIEVGPERPTDQPEAPSDRVDEPQPGEQERPSGSAAEAVEAHPEPGQDPGDVAERTESSTTTVAPDEAPDGIDLDLREPSEPEPEPAGGPVADDDLEVSNHARRPFGIGRSGAVETPTHDDDREREAPAGEAAAAPTNGAGAQTAGPPAHEVEATTTAEPLPAVEPLVEDDLRLTPDAGDAKAAAVKPEPAAADPDPGTGHETSASKREEPAPASAASGSESMFDLDLVELAARARAAGERAQPTPRPDLVAPRRAAGRTRVHEPAATVTEVADRDRVDEATPAPRRLPWVDEDEHADIAEDEDPDHEADGGTAAKTPSKARAATVAVATAALQRRRAKTKRYPRGQLKERIGVLRRVRAMLGVVVLTVVLGVAAGAAIGAFLVFVAFALRSAITTG
jgi:Meckel syndrome type 1 protein